MSKLTKPRPRRPGWLYRWMMAFLGLFDRWLHLSCRSFIGLASDKYERPLGWGERLRQTMHRAMCRLCRIQERRMDQLRALAHEVAHQADDDAHAELSPQALERMRTAMAEASARPGAGGGPKR
jgi:hypothetical protein